MVDTLYQGELDLGVVELFNVGTTGLASGNSFNLNDLDRVGTSTMTGTHITVTLCDSTTNSQVTVFTVHVVGTGTGIVTQPDTEILNFDGRGFVHLFDGDDFTGGLLEFLQLTQEIPETGFGNNVVGGKDSHLVERSLRFLLGGHFTADNLVFLQLK